MRQRGNYIHNPLYQMSIKEGVALPGRCSGSRSPCVKEISHQSTAKASQLRMKLAVKIKTVQRH